MSFFSLIFLLCLWVFCPPELRPTLTVFFRATHFCAVHYGLALTLIMNTSIYIFWKCYDCSFYVEVSEPFGIDFGIKNATRIQLKTFSDGQPVLLMPLLRHHPSSFSSSFQSLKGHVAPCSHQSGTHRSTTLIFPSLPQTDQKVPSPGSCRYLCHQDRREDQLLEMERAPLRHTSNVFLWKEKEKKKPQGRLYSLQK